MWARVPFADAALVGDPKRHLDREELLVALGEAEDVFATPAGCLEAIVLRRAEGGRSQPATAELSTTGGLLGDRWGLRRRHPQQLFQTILDPLQLQSLNANR